MLYRISRTVRRSDHPLAQAIRATYRFAGSIHMPAPVVVVVPLLGCVLLVRRFWFVIMRVMFCEPLFKAYCTSYGPQLRTGVFLHWVQGKGRLIVGRNVVVDGKVSITFARLVESEPELRVGDFTVISHECAFTVARSITIGNHCLIARGATLLDSSGHPLDPARRLAGCPPDPDQVRPIRVEDNVWIGSGAIILPGVTIGTNSVVAAGSVVRKDVPPDVVVAGNPAVVVKHLVDGNQGLVGEHDLPCLGMELSRSTPS